MFAHSRLISSVCRNLVYFSQTCQVQTTAYLCKQIFVFSIYLAVRQYGMQVVGKLQGTRRLPPPAWVPSIKAETGGLDSRVSLVPAGGGGWGAPSTSSADQPPVSSAATDSLPIVSTLPSVNGALYSETVGNSLEPAYTKFVYGNSDMGVTGVSTLKGEYDQICLTNFSRLPYLYSKIVSLLLAF